MFHFKNISLSSFRLCRRKPKSPATTHFFSPFNPKAREITYPITPSPPPTTPKYYNTPGFRVSDESGWLGDSDVEPEKTSGGGVEDDNGVCGKMMKETLTVVRWSEQPYEDFKVSMLEMILEKQMFEAKDLEELLQCFLTLNSRNHHADIVAAFTEIWELLFR